MDLRELLLIGHILGVVAMAFGSGTGMLATMSAGSSPDIPTMIRTARLESLGGRVTSFSAIVVLIFGSWLVIETEGLEFSQAWISASYTLWFVAMGVGGGIMGRHARKIEAQASGEAARGDRPSAALLAEWNAPITKAGGAFLLLMYPVFIYLMVAKPGL